MPTLVIRQAGREPWSYAITKRITTLGTSRENDVVLEGSEEGACQILLEGTSFLLSGGDSSQRVTVNGKARKRHTLAHQDLLELGDAKIQFSFYQDEHGSPSASHAAESLYRHLHHLSTRILNQHSIEDLLNVLMDSAIEITGADKGFLVLLDQGTPEIRVARNLHQENIEDAVEQLSDSIVAKVLESREPLIVSDALQDEAFSGAVSVLSLKVASVMCVPLKDQAEIIGLIYVGNDKITELFGTEQLQALTILASQASLVVKHALLINALSLDKEQLARRLEEMRFGRLIGSSPGMREFIERQRKSPTPTSQCLLREKRAQGKNLSQRRFTNALPAQKVRLSRSTVARYPKICWRVSYSDMCEGHLPVRYRIEGGSFMRPMVEPYFSMKSVNSLLPCK